MRKLYLSLITGFFASAGFAQKSDTLIYAEGKIISAETKMPVDAKISFRSEPYGNRTGSINGSTYSFPLFDKEKYSVEVKASGFVVSKFLFDPSQANAERKIIKIIELETSQKIVKKAEPIKLIVGNKITLDHLIFSIGTARITPESFSELDKVITMLNEYPRVVIQLEGHTDIQGNAKLNMKLSQDRVGAVKDYLVSKGISKGRVKTKAFGSTMPLSRKNTEEAHKMNRRVELRILEN